MRKTVAILAILSVLVLSACGGGEKGDEKIIRPVRYTRVTTLNGVRMRTFSGVVRSALESNLSFKVSGTITDVAVRVGDRLKKGELIAELDSEDYVLRVQEAEASARSAQAEARNADANYSRVRALYENNNASRDDLDSARAASESINAAVAASEKQLEQSRLQLSYTRLRAPVAGAISEVPVEVNENVAIGQRIVTLTSGSKMEVEVGVPEVLITDVRKGDAVTVTVSAIPRERLDAKVIKVGVSSTGSTTTFPVTVELLREDGRILPGMAAEVEFSFKSRRARGTQITLPTVAVGEDSGGKFVFMLERADGGLWKARRHRVSTGEIGEGGIEITSGLADGDMVVTAGVRRLVDDQLVRLLDTPGTSE